MLVGRASLCDKYSLPILRISSKLSRRGQPLPVGGRDGMDTALTRLRSPTLDKLTTSLIDLYER